MAGHEPTSRNYLANEVQAQRQDITRLVGAVAGLEAVVEKMVEDSREERKFTKELHTDLREQLYAQRSEQSQFSMSLIDVQSKMTVIAKTLAEHENERQQKVGAWKLATTSARIGWTMFGASVLALLAMISRHLGFGGSPPPGPHP